MAITRDQVRRAVENYLPSSLSVSQDSDTSTVDPEKVFNKLQTLVASAIITDPNSVYYLISLAVAELTDLIAQNNEAVQTLSSKDILFSAEQSDPDPVTSTVALQRALGAAAGLSSDSGAQSAEAFNTAIQDFQTNQLNALVERRNLKLIDEALVAQAAVLSTTVSELKLLVDRIEGGLSSIESANVRKLAVQNVSRAISERVSQIKTSIDSDEDAAEYAETYLVDLVAAKAAISILMSSEDFRGTTIISPQSNAKTLKTYLSVQGTATLTPQQYVARGSAGRPFLDYIFASRGGSLSATQQQVSAYLESEEDLSFPLSISSGSLVFDVNGLSETISINGTFANISDLVSSYNSTSTYTTAFANGQRVRIYAYASSTDPVGKDSSIELLSSNDAGSAGLHLLPGRRAVGSLVGDTIADSVVTLSSYTFPTRTVSEGPVVYTEYEAFVMTLSGSIHQITNVDTSANTISIRPGIPLEVVAGSPPTYEVSNLSYLVLRTAPGELFASGAGARTTKTIQNPSGIPITTFLPTSASNTGSTGSSVVKEPLNPVQATSTIQVQDNGLIVAGATVQILSDLFEIVPFGFPATLNQFAIGATEVETAANLKTAIDSVESDLSSSLSASISAVDATVVILTANSQNYQGSAGNSLATPVAPAGFLAIGFAGGLDAGATWSGDGVSGTLEATVRITSSDGTNQKESGTASVGAVKWSGSAGIAFKGYGSRTGSNWYAATDGTWGKILEQSTGAAGDTPSPSYLDPTNVMAFSGTSTQWTTSDAVVYWDDTADQDINAGMWFVMTAWAENGSSGAISGPLTGVGGGPGTGTSGTAGTSYFISAVSGGRTAFTIKAPAIDVDGNGIGGELGETWADFGWSTTAHSTSIISMTGYFFDPDKFLIGTAAHGFTGAYSTETGYFVPQAGDFVYYEKEVSGTTYRTSTEITSITSNLEASLQDTGGTNGSGDFIFARRNTSPSLANYPQQTTGVKYTLVRDVSTAQTRFFASSATSAVNLSSKGISAGDLLHITTAGSNNGWYIIKSINSDGELFIDSAASGNAPDGTAFKTAFSYPEDVSWEIVATDYQQRLTDSSATFLTNSVASGDTIVISSGSFAGNYNIDAVENETSLKVTATTPSYKGGPFTSADTPTYYVPTNDILGGVSNKFFRSPSSYFYGSVFAGDVLTVSSVDYVVDSVSSSNTLELTTNFSSYFSGQAFEIRKAAATSGDYTGLEVTNKFKIDLSANAGLTDLQDIGGIEVDAQIDIDITSGTDLRDGFLKITSGSNAGTYSIQSVDPVDGIHQTIFLDEEIPVSTGGDVGTLTWQVLAGTTTNTFIESDVFDAFIFSGSSTSAFYTHPPAAGDTLVISPGEAGEQRVGITSVDTATQLTLDEAVAQGQSSLTYSILPAEYPQIGQELVAGGYRSKITDVTIATGGSTRSGVLELESVFPLSMGISVDYFVVAAGGDPTTSFIEDLDPDVSHDDELVLSDGFLTAELGDLTGNEIQISAGRDTFRTSIARVVNETSLEMARPLNTVVGEVFYRIMSRAQGKSKELSHPSTLSQSIESTDLLTIWQVEGTLSSLTKTTGTTSSGTDYTKFSFDPQVESGLTDLDFVVARGGGEGYGRYVLLLEKLTEITTRLDAYKFSDFNLRLGEVLSKHGTDKVDILSDSGVSPAATPVDDGDGDLLTNRFDVSVVASHDLGGVRVGDRIEIVYFDPISGGTTTYTTWVVLGDRALQTNPISRYDTLEDGLPAGTTRCLVSPEIPLITPTSSIQSWKIQRNSISFALFEGVRLRLLMEALRQVTQYYSVNTSTRIDTALQLLRDEGYDRMADLLTTGQYAAFFSTSYEDGSYQESMKKVMRDIGNLILDLRNG